MENANKKTTTVVKVPEKGLLHLVSSIIKDKQLFPEKMEDAKNYLSNLKLS